jgi:coproporphyrinogen III oxidase-like Fe-S oxidoreductase
MLALRLDQPLPLARFADALDPAALARMEALALVRRSGEGKGGEVALTPRGRFVGDAVAAELVA